MTAPYSNRRLAFLAALLVCAGSASVALAQPVVNPSGVVNPASSLLTITNGPNFGSFQLGLTELALNATGGTGAGYTWSLDSGALPPGLSVRNDGVPSYFAQGVTGGILGVSTTTVYSPPATFTIRVTDNAFNTATKTFTMSVIPLAITDPSQFADGMVNVPYSYTPHTSSAVGTVTWALPNGGLPAGLSLNTSTGQISGTPTAQGNFGFNLQATDSTGTLTRFYNIQIFGVGISGSGDLGNYHPGFPVNITLSGTGGTAPYTFAPANSLPPGLTLSSSGALSGTLTATNTGTYHFNVTVTDHNGSNFNKSLVLNIAGNPTLPNLNYQNPTEDATTGESRGYSFNVNGGQSPYTWTISAGSPPPGMLLQSGTLPYSYNLGPDDAIVWGTPTQTGTYNFTISLKDSSPTPFTVSQPMTINVKALGNNYPGPNPTRGSAYSFYLQPVGSTTPYSWSIAGGNLPAGLSLNTSTGVVSGTPTENGFFTIFANITAGGVSINRYIGFNVNSTTNPQISINGGPSLPDGLLNSNYNDFINACCATNGISFSAVSSLPAGLNLSAGGQLTGTPTVAGKYNVEILATDNNNAGNFGVRFFTLNIAPFQPNISIPPGFVGTSFTTTFTATGGTGTLTWILGSGSQLPPGLTFNNGTLSGTPTSAGTFNLNYIVSDTASHTFNGYFSVNVAQSAVGLPPYINFGPNFGTWLLGEIQYGLSAIGGDGNYSWSVVNGSLPTGVSLRTDQPFPTYFPVGSQAGFVGLATTPGNYAFTVAVTSAGQTTYQYCTWRITGLNFMDGGLPQAFAGVPYSYTLTALNAAGPVTWNATNALPPGLTLSSAGVLSGTPSSPGNFNFNLSLTDGFDPANRGFNLNVSAVRFTTNGVLANVQQGGTVNVTFAAAGGTGGYMFTSPGLPGGLSLTTGGLLTGTLNDNIGLNTFTVTVTDSTSESYSQIFSIDEIGNPALLPAINLGNLQFTPTAAVGFNYSRLATLSSGGAAPFNWTVTGLPPGMGARPYNTSARTDLAPGNVEIWGTPTATGTYNVTYTVTDVNGLSATLVAPFKVSALGVDGQNYLPNGTLGQAYSSKLRVLGGTGPYTVSQVDTTYSPLPDGLTLNAAAFTVSGTPLESGNFGPIFQLNDSGGNTLFLQSGFNIATGTSPNINLNNYFNLGYALAGSNYSFGLNACCATSGTYTWTLAGGTLPTGINLSSAGVLSGTPTAPGPYTFLIKAADSVTPSNFGLKQFVLDVTPIALNSNNNLPFATVGSLYNYQILTSGGAGAIAFSIASGNGGGTLPPGITLSGGGVLNGTPTTTGQFQFSVYMSDNSGNSQVQYFNLPVYASGTAPAVGITTGPNLGTFSIGEIQDQLTASGGTGTYTWSVTGGSLPPGLSLRSDKPGFFSAGASAGIIGVATAAQSTPYQFTLTATSGTQSASLAFSMKITNLTCKENAGYRLPDAFLTTSYSYTLTPLQNAGTVTFGSPNQLPPGLTLSPSGVLSGTPTTAGFYNFNFTINDTVDTVTIGASIDVFAVNITSVPVLPNATQNASYSFTYTASGGTGPYTYTASGTPGGLSLSSAGVLSGTVTGGPGRYNVNVTAIDHNSVSHNMLTGLTVIGVPPALPYIQPYGNFDDCSYGMECSRGLNVIDGGTAPFTWNVTGLPQGMGFRFGYGNTSPNITPSDVELWGVPLALGTFNITATVTDFTGITTSQTFPLTVSPLFVDGSDYLPGGTRGTAYSKLLRVLGGTPAGATPLYGAQVTLGVLPAGLSLSGLTVSGTPTENGNFQPRFTFTDSASNALHQTEGFGIGNSGSNTISLSQYDYGTTGSANDIVGYFAVGSSVNFGLGCGTTCTWSVIGGTMPTGLSVNSSGVITGTVGNPIGTFNFTVQAAAANNSSNIGVRQYTIVVVPANLNITNASPLPYGTLNAAYTPQQLSSTAAVSFSLLPEYNLPPGLSMNSSGLISGTPTATGQYFFYVMATDASNNIIIRQYNIPVYVTTPPLFLGTGPTIGPDSPGPHNTQLTASGGTPPYHYSFTPNAAAVPGFRVQDGGQLPAGFSLTSGTGGFLGVSPGSSSYPTSLRVTDSLGATYDRAITLYNSSLTVLNPNNPPGAVVNTAYSYQFAGYGGSGTYTWSATGLPAGITMGNSSGVISGTPSASGSFGFTVTVTDTNGIAEAFNYTLTVYPFAITTGQILPQGTIGTAYSQTLAAPGCTSCVWSMINGGLPGGLSLNSAGVISGTPTGFSNSTFLLQAAGSNGNTQKEFALLVPFNTPQPVFITSNSNLSYTTVGNGYSSTVAAQGGTPPYTWSVVSGTLPPGVFLSGSGETLGFNFGPGFTYVLGKPQQVGTYNFTLQATDAANNNGVQAFTWVISPLNFNMATFPFNGTAGTYGAATPTPTLGVAYSQPLLVIGGSGNYVSWTTPLATNPLPPGLMLDPSSGLVSGTPSATGSFSSLVQVTDDASNVYQQFVTFNVASPSGTSVNINNGPNLGVFASGSTVVFNLNPSGGTAPYTFTVVDSLPPGCALETGSALLSNANGTYDLSCSPLTSGAYSFTLKATDSVGNVGVRVFSIIFTPTQIFTNTSLLNGSVGTAYSQTLLAWDNAGTVAWALLPSSAMPPGLTLNGSTISGTPTTAGSYSFTLSATDSATSDVINYTFSITISSITITSPSIIPTQALFLAPFSYQFTATGGNGSNKTWSATGVPSGLTLSSSGLLSGSVTSTGAFTITVKASDTSSSVTKLVTLFARYSDPSILTFANNTAGILADARLGQSYSATLSPSGGTPPYIWSVANGSNLPPGLSLYNSAVSGNLQPGITVLAGEPTAAGQYSFDLTVTDNNGATATHTFTLNVSPIAVLSGALPNGIIGTAYSRQLTAVGGTGPYTYTFALLGLNTGMFPPGISPTSSGLISGTPTSTGSFSFYATATDNAGHSYRTSYTLVVTNANGLEVTSSPVFSPVAGSGFTTSLATNGSSTYTWSIQAGSLPPGVTLSSAGAISGAASAPGTYNFTVRATDNANNSNFADRQFTMQVTPMQFNFNRAPIPPATVGAMYTYTFNVVGGTAPYTFTPSPLYPQPPGLTLSSAGVLSGTPTQSGAYFFYVNLTDHAGNSGYAFSGTISVLQSGLNVPLAGSIGQFHDGSLGQPYSILLSGIVSGGVLPITVAVAPGSNLPPGLTILQGPNGIPPYLAGIPTTAGSYSFELVTTDAVGQTAVSQEIMNVSPLSLSPNRPPDGVVGTPYFAPTPTISGGTPPYSITLNMGSSLPPGLTPSAAGLSGTPTVPGNYNIILSITDSATPSNNFVFGYFLTIDQAGAAPAISLNPENPVQISYVIGGPAPSPVPLNVNSTSGTPAFTSGVLGIPALSLSAASGSAPATLTLNTNTTGLVAGTYPGVIALHAPTTFNVDEFLPVELTVVNPPPCTYTLVPPNGTITASGGSGSFTVSTGSLCSWTATAADPFVTISPGSASGTGSGTVQYSLTANGASAARASSISVNGQTYSITQFGSSCALSITPNSVIATAAGGLAAVNVTTTSSVCAWTASGLGASPTSGTGNGSVTFIIPPTASATTVNLNASVQLNGGATSTFSVTQSGVGCTVGLSASGAEVGYSGGTGQVNVTTPAGCSYSTLNGPSWVTVTNNASGSGPGPVALTYSVAANSTTTSRSGTLTIGSSSYAITQDPTPCSVTVDASNSGSPFGTAGSVSGDVLHVTANGGNCTWTASSPVPWITVSPSFGSGNMDITLNVTSNTSSTTSRSTNLTVAGQSVAVTQGGTICNYALGSTNSSIPYGGGTGSVSVTAPAACGWSSALDPTAPWLSISSSGSGGTSNVVFTAAPNATSSARAGTLTIAGQAFTVNQAAGPCSYILSGSGTTAPLAAAGGFGLFTFSTGTSGCSTTGVSFANWLTATTSSSPDGTSGTVSFTATANPAGSTRTGTIQFGGQTYSVSQTGAACAFSLNSYGLALSKAGGGGSVIGSPSAQGCPLSTGVDQPSIVTLGTLMGPVGNIFTLPFTVVSYNSTVTGIRVMIVSFGGQLFTIKQTSW